MKLVPILKQTNALIYLPFILAVFNISLARANTSFTILPALAEKLGKLNKDNELRKTDYQIKTIVIDAGHGGRDPGCSGKNSREKHLALAIAQKLAKNIKTVYPNLKVIMTRDSDVFIPLHERAAVANRNQADLFISIHCNFMPKLSYVQGSETYVMGLHTAEHNLEVAKRENASILLEADYEKNYDYDPDSPEGHIMLSMFQNVYLDQSILFAEMVEEKIHTEAKRKSRGVKQAGFVVLKETTMPSILIEAGFLSSAKEEQFLRTEKGQQEMADAIASAFTAYKQTIEKNNTDRPVLPVVAQTPPPPPPATANPVLTRLKETPPSAPASSGKDDFQQPAFETNKTDYSSPAPQREPKIITLQGSRISSPDYRQKQSTAQEVNGFTPTSHSNIQFYIQLAASRKLLNIQEGKWLNLNYQIEVVEESDYYKYQIRNFFGFQQASYARKEIQRQGFPDAFIVPYKNGERIRLEEAKKELGIE